MVHVKNFIPTEVILSARAVFPTPRVIKKNNYQFVYYRMVIIRTGFTSTVLVFRTSVSVNRKTKPDTGTLFKRLQNQKTIN